MLKMSLRSRLVLSLALCAALPGLSGLAEAGRCNASRMQPAVRYYHPQAVHAVQPVAYFSQPTVIHQVAPVAFAAAPPITQLAPAVVAAAPADIVDTAVAAKFSTLVAAVKAAGLVETLKGKGPFTVFAPTDEAFAKLPKETLESLLKPENKDKLAAILTYHVVAGKVTAADVVKLTEAKTVNGKSVKITVENGVVKIDGAKVTKTDVTCSNGVIHIIDTVIIPKEYSSSDRRSEPLYVMKFRV